MTGRERVLSSLNHRQPDSVPIDFGGHRSSGIMAISYRGLRDYLELPEKPLRVFDMVQQLAVIDEDILDLFHVDTVEIGRAFLSDERAWKQWILPDGGECWIPSFIDVRRYGEEWILYTASGKPSGVQKKGMLYFEQIQWPYIDGVPTNLEGLPRALEEILWTQSPFPNLNIIDIDTVVDRVKTLRESTDLVIIFPFGGQLFETAQYLCRQDHFLSLMALDPLSAHRLLEKLLEIRMTQLDRLLAAIGRYVDIVGFGDDLGMQSGPLISPEMYREFLKPRHQALWTRAKELADVKVMLHSCGGIEPFLEDLIEAGLDAVNPVQTSATGMDPVRLKRICKDRLCLWGGGCDTQFVLGNATADRVREHVLNRLEIMFPGGGFVFQQVHNIMANVPPGNVEAMFRAVRDFPAVGGE
jgi:uroporphyrinogen decarboxylase